jgi:hypothetical protein
MTALAIICVPRCLSVNSNNGFQLQRLLDSSDDSFVGILPLLAGFATASAKVSPAILFATGKHAGTPSALVSV